MDSSNKDKGVWPSEKLPFTWAWAPMDLVFNNETSSNRKLKQKKYLLEGRIAVIDQGQELVGGYTNDDNIAFTGELPVIIFGDHTRCVKYIDFPFAQGADGVKVLSPTSLVDPKFSYYSLHALSLPDKGYSRHFKFLKETQFPIPPLPEQKRIAKKIEALQYRSSNARKALETIPPLLEKFRQSVLSSAFRGDLTTDWRAQNPDIEPAEKLLERIRKERRKRWEENELAKMKAKGKPPKDDKWKKKYKEPEPVDTSDLPELPEGWCWISLPECGEMSRGKSKHRPRNDPRLLGGKYPFIQTGAVSRAKGHIKNTTKFYSEFGLQQSRLFPTGTVCITIAANIAETAVLDIDACFPDSVVGVIVDYQLISPDYLEFYVRTIRDGLSAFAPATAQKNINIAILNKVAVPIPPDKERKKIEHILSQSLKHANKVEEQYLELIAGLENLDQSILARAFRGELVLQDPNDESAAQLLERIKQEKASLESGKKKRARRGRAAKNI